MHAELSGDHEAQLLKQAVLIASLHEATENASKLAPNMIRNLVLGMFSYDILGVHWWIYALSTTGMSLIGSRGLVPSLGRNIGLAALGKFGTRIHSCL